MNKFLQSCAVAAALSTMTVRAHAAYFTYSIDNPGGTNGGGDIKNIQPATVLPLKYFLGNIPLMILMMAFG